MDARDRDAAIEPYLNAAERWAGKRFSHRAAIAALIVRAGEAGRGAEFERLVFLAKFVSGAFDILRRSGPGADDTRHLVRELNAGMEEVASLIGAILAAGPDDAEAGRFRERFLVLTQESMEALRGLLQELSWIKQFMLAGNRPPLPPKSTGA